jgi:hypothetical protein
MERFYTKISLNLEVQSPSSVTTGYVGGSVLINVIETYPFNK